MSNEFSALPRCTFVGRSVLFVFVACLERSGDKKRIIYEVDMRTNLLKTRLKGDRLGSGWLLFVVVCHITSTI